MKEYELKYFIDVVVNYFQDISEPLEMVLLYKEREVAAGLTHGPHRYI